MKAQSEGQDRKTEACAARDNLRPSQESRYQQRNKKAGVLKPEPKNFIAAIPTELPGEKNARC